jgi:N-acetyl-anhydromuramyl-L-alanine amidase AmpD
MKVDASVIDRWHREKGWLKIGYHYVINRDGSIEIGRETEAIGAHAKGYNATSVGICLVGGLDDDGEPEDNFTEEQWNSLDLAVDGLVTRYPNAKVIGHNNVSSKSCPCFDVGEWYGNRYRV